MSGQTFTERERISAVAQGVTEAKLPVSHEGTRWSLVRRASFGSREALEELGRIYWPVVFAYAERQRLSREDAQDVTQQVFTRILRAEKLDELDPSKGRFRAFLFACTQHEISRLRRHEATAKRGAGLALSFEGLLEEPWRGLLPAEAPATAESFDRAWSSVLVARCTDRIARDYAKTGKLPLFEAFKALLHTAPEHGGFRALGEKLQLSEGAARIAWLRFRRTFVEYLRQEVAETVADAAETEDELRYLIEAWARAGE